jgi:DNA-binding CsgD family transcriptional regulator/tetratricopeptide (TPR) repeat protein
MPAVEVAGHLGALVDKSLVQLDGTGTGPGRYRLLDTVRQYAAARLDALGPAEADNARIAHRDYYLTLAEAAAPQLLASGQAQWLDRLDTELGNLRAAIAVSQAQPDPAPGLRLAASLRLFWRARGHIAEGVDALRSLLDAPATPEATLPRARALAAAADLLEETGGFATAEAYCQEALAIARAAHDDHLVADLLHVRAWSLMRQGRPGAALPVIDAGLELARRLGEPHLTARMLFPRSYATHAEGDPAGAARDMAEAVRLFRVAGDRIQVGASLGNLGYIELSMGNVAAARSHLAESLAVFRGFNDRSGIVYQAFNLGLAEYLGGSLGPAEALFAESLDLAGRVGMKRHTAYALLGLALAGHGGADAAWSARLHGAADWALADLGETLEPLEGRLAGRGRERLRAALGAEAFEAEYAAGRALDPAQVLAALGGNDAPAGTVLTPRELEVLKLVAQGLGNADIAQRLVLSEHTVHRHLANILHKLNLSSRAAAAAWGIRAGLV